LIESVTLNITYLVSIELVIVPLKKPGRYGGTFWEYADLVASVITAMTLGSDLGKQRLYSGHFAYKYSVAGTRPNTSLVPSTRRN
jgi:hypothetical protein